MSTKTRVNCSLSSLILFVGFAFIAGSSADAQQKKIALPPHFSDNISGSFHSISLKQAIAVIDQLSGLNILIDGEPLKPSAEVNFDGTLEEALNRVADIFDYNWKVTKGGIVLFNKRFKNRDDAPQATLPEITHLVNNIAEIFALANVDPDQSQWVKHVKQMGALLTDEQWATLLSRKFILARDLTPEQFAHLRAAVMGNTFADHTKDWTELTERLRSLKTTYLVGHRLPDDPANLGAAAQYAYEIVWHKRDGSLTSDNVLTKFFGSD